MKICNLGYHQDIIQVQHQIHETNTITSKSMLSTGVLCQYTSTAILACPFEPTTLE